MLLRKLNSGAAGVVHLAVDTRSGEQVAIKLLKRGSKDIVLGLRHELLHHRLLAAHPYVIGLKVRTLQVCLSTTLLCKQQQQTHRCRRRRNLIAGMLQCPDEGTYYASHFCRYWVAAGALLLLHLPDVGLASHLQTKHLPCSKVVCLCYAGSAVDIN